MKKHLILFFSAIVLISCGSEEKNETELVEEVVEQTIIEELVVAESMPPCDLISESYLSEKFVGMAEFRKEYSDSPYPFCSSYFNVEEDGYYVGLTLVENTTTEETLEKGVSVFEIKETIEGVGQKAYYIPLTGQISAWDGNNLIHLSVTVNGQGDKEKAKEIALEVLGMM